MSRIVITGASSGLGYGIAEAYARRGWHVGVAARREAPLKELQAKYPELIDYEVIDVTAPEAAERLALLISKGEGMDIFVQVAGVGKQNPGLDSTIERTTLMTNCVGFTAMIDTAYKYFAENPERKGTIAAITSVAGTAGLGMAASYSASKRFESTYITALEQLAHMQRINVKFCDIRPGFISTALLDTTAHRYPMLMQPDYAVKRIVKAIDRRRRIAIVDYRWHWVVGLWRLLPRWLWVRLAIKTGDA